MKGFLRYRYAAITVFIIVSLVFLFTTCVTKNNDETDVIKNYNGQVFAGSATCASCHKNIYDSHLKTAHYLTSRIASKECIKGSFEPGKNNFAYDFSRVVAMEERDSSFYQVAYINGTEKNAHRMDIVIGSATMGQSYLNWSKNRLYQLPITYFRAADKWSNSPGYPNKIVFNRPITSRCLECHTTFAETISAPGVEPEKFEPSKMIYGVDCEKCHGPGAQHVAFQTQTPSATIAKYIINPSRLSRQQNLDLCASCHGGRLQKTTPSFQFTAGDSLSKFFNLDTTAPDPNKIDVHGNQYGLLRVSKCFKNSETMTCNTCHNSHKTEKGNTDLFSQRCMSCHQPEHENFCKMSKKLGPEIKNNCIDCHMPLKASRAIAVFLPGNKTPTAALIRSHLIANYPEETTKNIINFMKKK